MADYDLQYQDTYIDVLLATANELKTAGYIYKGVATPSTNPGTPTERVAYLASEPGTYTSFGGIVITSGLYSLTYDSGTWTGTQMQAGSDIEVVQTTGQSTSAVMSQKAVTDEIGKCALVEENESTADLDISDENGNALVRFSGGHVLTKYFNSQDLKAFVGDSDNADLDINDEDGNILVRFSGGHIKTKYFDSSMFVKLPYQRRYSFQYNVECSNPIMTKYTAVNINTNDIVSRKYVDNAVLYLPKTYTPLGQATKIVIYCKHGQSVVEPSHDEVFVSTTVSHYFLSLGYAILAADGLPNDWATLLGLCERVVGNYVAVQSMKKAYDIATNLFNLDKTGCFVYGFSQGGHYAQNVVDMSGIPVCAVAEMSPACSYQFHQWDLTTTVNIGGVTFTKGGRINVARIFGYPAVSNNTQLLALQYDEKKQQGYDPYLRNVVNPYKGFIQNGNLWVLPEGTTIEDITDMKKYLKAPLKIWCCTGDTALSDDVTQVFIKAARNAGQVAEIQVYEGGDHNVELAQDSIGSFIDDGVTYQLKPIMKEIAIWFSQFGGINV